MRVWIVLLMLGAVGLAGCFGGDDADDDAAGDKDPGPDDAGEDLETDEGVTVSFDASNATGSVPFDVTFSWSIQGQVDNLSWTLDVDGDTKPETEGALPQFNYTHTFDTAGTYNATLAVRGDGFTIDETIEIEALPSDETPPDQGEGDGTEDPGAGNGTEDPGAGNGTEEPAGPYFLEDADDNVNEWTVGHEGDGLQPDWAITSEAAQSGANSWGTSLPGPAGYADESHVYMISPGIDLSAASSPRLYYSVQGGSELDYDFMYVQIAKDGGAWKEIAKFSGIIDEWATITQDLSSLRGGTVQLRFSFVTDANCSGTTPLPSLCDDSQLGPGWFVDDIRIEESA